MSKLNAGAELEIKSIVRYKNDVKVIREVKHRRSGEKLRRWYHDGEGGVFVTRGLRQEITEFSKSARKNLAFIASNTDVDFTHMITLTYPKEFPKDGRIIKKHLNTLLQWMRRREVTAYLWFLEFQKRGAPHFHILYGEVQPIDRFDLSKRWFEIVGSGDKKHLHAGTRIDRARKHRGFNNYAVKYAQKLYQKDVPENFVHVGRLWGVSRSCTPSPIETIQVSSESELKEYLRGWEYEGEETNGYNVLFNASYTVGNNNSSRDCGTSDNRMVDGGRRLIGMPPVTVLNFVLYLFTNIDTSIIMANLSQIGFRQGEQNYAR